MALTTVASRTVNEKSSMIYTATLLDSDGTALPSASITVLTLTLYDVLTGDIINSRDALTALNANQVTIHATSGLLTWTALPADSPIVGTPQVGELEHHVALFEVEYSSTKEHRHEVNLYVKQLTKVA